MKRVLIFSLAYYPHVGGAEIAVKEITDRLPGIDFSLIALRMASEPREERISHVTVYRVGNGNSYLQKILYVPRAALCAARLHRSRSFNAFWAMMSYMLFPIVLLRFIGVRTPYILTLQEGDPWQRIFARWFILPFRPLLSVGFKNALVVQAISTYLAGWARGMGFCGQLEIIGNGVDTAHFVGIPVSHDGTILITTSRLVRKNAIDDIIHALKFLPEVRLRILGTGPEKAALRQLAALTGIGNRVEFVGHVDHADIPPYLHAADIFIRPSRSEGMGNSFIEAMAADLPVVATQEGGIADFLFDAKRNLDKPTTGWAVDKNSPGQIAKAVQDILAHPEQVERVKATAKKMAIEKYDWNLIAKQMRKVFDRVFEKR